MSAPFRLFSFAAAAALLVASTSAAALDEVDAQFTTTSNSTPSSGAIAMDLLVLRPLSLVGTILGGAVFVIGLPVEVISGDVSGPAHRLVGQPASFTFSRPLGETGGRED